MNNKLYILVSAVNESINILLVGPLIQIEKSQCCDCIKNSHTWVSNWLYPTDEIQLVTCVTFYLLQSIKQSEMKSILP